MSLRLVLVMGCVSGLGHAADGQVQSTLKTPLENLERGDPAIIATAGHDRAGPTSLRGTKPFNSQFAPNEIQFAAPVLGVRTVAGVATELDHDQSLHSVSLMPTPGALVLLGIGSLVMLRRKRAA